LKCGGPVKQQIKMVWPNIYICMFQAIKCFSRAMHIHPCEQELWEEDLQWACSLLQKKTKLEAENEELNSSSKLKITEIEENCENSEIPERTEHVVVKSQSTSKTLEPVQVEHRDYDTNDGVQTASLNRLPSDFVRLRDT
jgi:hypothetical protein